MSDEQNKKPGRNQPKPDADKQPVTEAATAGTSASGQAATRAGAADARGGAADKTGVAPGKPAAGEKTAGRPGGKATAASAGGDGGARRPPSGSARAAGPAWLALLLAVLVGLGAAIGGYWLWQQLREAADNNVTEARISALEARLAQRDQALEQGLQALSQDEEQLREQAAQTEQTLTELARGQQELERRLAQVGRLAETSRDEWMRSEAAYLAQIAVYRLNFQADVDTALAALQAADRLLAQLGTEALVQRRAVRGAVNRLLEVDQQDRLRLDQALSDLIDRVPELPLAAERLRDTVERAPDDAAAANASAVDGWAERLANAWQRFTASLSELVVVRRDSGVLPLVAPEQRYYLRQNLILRLETARLALHRGEQALYEDALADAVEWLSTWYDSDAPGVAQARELLAELRSRELAPQLPDIAPLLEPLQLFEE